MLYDLVQCPHRPTMDIHADPKKKNEISAFVKLLWEKGNLHETAIMEGLTIPFLDLSGHDGETREKLTADAMSRGETLIFGGRISAGDLLGDPDLLRKENDGYIAGDIKSGVGLEGSSEDLQKPKVHYGVQVALYTDILEQKGISPSRIAFIWDVNGDELIYDLNAPLGKRKKESLWDEYQSALNLARQIAETANTTLPANSSVCKLCHWYSACQENVRSTDDLTLISELGRSKRDVMMGQISSVNQLAGCDINDFFDGKKTVFRGIGQGTLEKMKLRAGLLCQKDASPVQTGDIVIPNSETELFFDIEVDPFNDICYLHGFTIRKNQDPATEEYIAFFSDSLNPDEEKKVFSEAYKFIKECQPCAMYYYSKYERTIWRKLQEKYPDVCSADDIEAIFDPSFAIDLYYDVVKSSTEWPTNDYSLKTLAKFLGFKWRDTEPSGAASIEWFNQYCETQDPAIKERILEYNEDDCRATAILLDGIKGFIK